jgi:very-short-patch-repair endonuclease
MNNKYKIRRFKCLGCGKDEEKRRSKHSLFYCSLECYRKSKRPNRKKGKIINCLFCNKPIYKKKCQLRYENSFCSRVCANKYQGRRKSKFICKTCGNIFRLSKSLADSRQYAPKYCSIKCRDKDPDWVRNACIAGNLIQQNKKGLNKLELLGREILKEIGVSFKEQVLMFDKFLVDVLIAEKNLIIQWDGSYWHTRTERIKLDKSQDAYLTKCGYTVLRITDKDIKNNKERVYENIKRAIR